MIQLVIMVVVVVVVIIIMIITRIISPSALLSRAASDSPPGPGLSRAASWCARLARK